MAPLFQGDLPHDHIVWQFAPRFQFRPEVFRWAEAMRGTIQYGFVQAALHDGAQAVEAALASPGAWLS